MHGLVLSWSTGFVKIASCIIYIADDFMKLAVCIMKGNYSIHCIHGNWCIPFNNDTIMKMTVYVGRCFIVVHIRYTAIATKIDETKEHTNV